MSNVSIFKQKIYAEDTDHLGIVFHSNYLNYCERARLEWTEENGICQKKLKQDGILFVVRKTSLDYFHPAYFNDILTIHTKLIKSRYCSMTFEQIIENQEGKKICQVMIKIACLDNNLKPRAIPGEGLK
jgi:acyl-CoA thioester hydrolase